MLRGQKLFNKAVPFNEITEAKGEKEKKRWGCGDAA
jgi:hypothetical protein